MGNNATEAGRAPVRVIELSRARRRVGRVWGAQLGLAVVALFGATACSLDGLLNSDKLPPNVSDPAVTQTPDGARAAYYGTLAKFRATFGGFRSTGITQNSFVVMTALLTDELLRSTVGIEAGTVDQRFLPEGSPAATDQVYADLQKTRAQAGQAIALLTRYLPDSAFMGHLYALEGYTEIFLAELFCSGIPLSTIDYDGDFTYHVGSTTDSVFTHARTLFDTALTLAGDSARFMDLARVGRGQAFLALGEYAAAAAAVGAVSDGYGYEVSYNTVTLTGTGSTQNFAMIPDGNTTWSFTVPNREGDNGLDWRTSGDPRTPVVDRGSIGSTTLYYPSHYAIDGSTPIVLASGIEARLIEAEAALQQGDTAMWLAKLNGLRETAIVPALADTMDPGTSAARVNLLFRERGFWMYLTGHRQGDLRRLLRQYHRTPDTVYPVGSYPAEPVPYGSAVTAPIPVTELSNPLFTGCASTGA